MFATTNCLSYINNAAISLLERDMPALCMETFKDSLDMNLLLKEQTLRNSHGIPYTSNHHVKAIHLLIRNTSRRLDCMKDHNTMLSSFNNNKKRNPIIVLDFDSDDCFESIVTIPMNMLTCIDFLFRMDYECPTAVTNIRAVPHLVSSYKSDIKIDSAVAFFNYGVACRRFHNNAQQQEQHQQVDNIFFNDSYYSDKEFCSDVELMKEAMKLFRAAFHMMSDQLSALDERLRTDYHIIIQDRKELLNVIRIVLLSKLITTNLCILSYDMCMIDLGDEYYSKYKPLSDLFYHLFNEYKKLPSICIGAAPAA